MARVGRAGKACGARRIAEDVSGILSDIGRTLDEVRPGEVESLARAILAAGRVYIGGVGRSGLVSSCFAMRLVHLGLVSHVVGEATAPGLGRGDLLVIVSGSGRTRTVIAQAKAAKSRGARVAAVTADVRSPLARAADLKVAIPCRPYCKGKLTGSRGAGTGPAAGAVQPGGSLFEQSALVFFDAMVLELARRLDWSPKKLGHTQSNLE